uniref:Uncharacterized protein n=1 Tax=Panagrolaimus sp. PS1159 TaxID=55785 RepID=A0AC35GFF8_9BILA
MSKLEANQNKIGPQAKTPSRKTAPSKSPLFRPDKKPKLDFRNYSDKIDSIVEKAPAVNPLLVENLALKSEAKEREEYVKKLEEMLKESKTGLKLHEKRLTANYEQCGDARQRQMIRDEKKYFDEKYGESAPEVVAKLFNKYDTINTSVLTAAETGHILQASGINLNQSRKLRSELKTHGVNQVFASERKVNEEKKRIRDGINFEEKYVKLKVKAKAPLETKLVTFMSNPEEYYRRRMQNILDNGLYRKIMFEGKEELWNCITMDKGATRTVLGMMPGNTIKACLCSK